MNLVQKLTKKRRRLLFQHFARKEETMKNSKMTWKITQGMYVLTSEKGGCIVDAVSQVSGGDNPLISVAVMKKNYTNELLKQGTKFALSVLGLSVNPAIIKNFGFHSARDYNKFEQVETVQVQGLPVIPNSLGYMICEIVDKIENDTHTIFIGKLVEADLFSDEPPMSYAYYQEHKEELLKVTTEAGQTAWVCLACGYVYYGEEVPEDFKCPVCGVGKELFRKKE